ncbi:MULTISPECIES: RNA polymerase sigma factor [Sphingobacterium]|uniref:RNA polymerase sigma factor n=1 Tax=Sphingobacterium TaxID=28453 RepID=UPI00257A2C5C|nr:MULTISPECIES: sigma-70 family RNA polymerase sigma factor [Sphingobacterium]
MNTQALFFERLRQGEETALDYYVNEHTESLCFIAFKLVKDELVAEEIVGDAFLKLWQQKGRIESSEHLYRFLVKVIKNDCLNHLKKISNLPKFEANYDQVSVFDDQDIHFEIIYAEFIKILYSELDKLPVQQATVFKMSYLDGQSTAEICEILNTTQSTVFAAKSKALQTLRTTFKKRDIFLYFFFTLIFLGKN